MTHKSYRTLPHMTIRHDSNENTTPSNDAHKSPGGTRDLFARREVILVAFVDDLTCVLIQIDVGIVLHFHEVFAQIIGLWPIRRRPFLTIPPTDQIAFDEPVLVCATLGPPHIINALCQATRGLRCDLGT